MTAAAHEAATSTEVAAPAPDFDDYGRPLKTCPTCHGTRIDPADCHECVTCGALGAVLAPDDDQGDE